VAAHIHELKRPVDPDVVDILERALEKAKSGEINGVLVLSQDPNAISYAIAGVKERFTVLGWLSHAMHRLQTDD
jgi:hypothetical protein